jgi:TonB-linked SusC/RagA family outer membrane protein
LRIIAVLFKSLFMLKLLQPKRMLTGLLLLLFAFHFTSFGQTPARSRDLIKVTETVTDLENSSPVPGVSILIKGRNKGATTNSKGDFSIAADAGDILIFSYIGYAKQEIAVTGSSLKVQLKPDASGLNEVLVVGYGTQRKSSVTGSVSSLSARQIKDHSVTTFENAILGQIAGVQVQEPSGEPGSAPTIRIRGVGSISAGNEPLYVIDGFPVSKNVEPGVQGDVAKRTVAFRPQPSNPLGTLSASDIESIEVLKDASSAAIYGSRGSNGVVLITTKKGSRDGSPSIGIDSYTGFQNVARRVELMNSAQLTAYVKDARNNAYLQDVPGASAADNNATRVTKVGAIPSLQAANYVIPDDFVNPTGTDTDWQDVLFQTAAIHNSTVSVSGGSDKFGYYVSGNYYDQNGIIDATGFKRYSLRINLDAQPFPKLKVGFHLNPSFTDQQRGSTSAPYFADPPGAVYTALVTSPTVSAYLPDGSVNQSDNQSHLFTETGATANMTASSNPLAVIKYIHDNLSQFRTFSSGFAEYEILKDFKYKLYAGADINSYNKDYYREKAFRDRDATVGMPFGQSNSSLETNWLVENTLAYDKTFGDHTLSVVGGYTAQKDRLSYNQVQAENYPDDLVQTVSGGQVTGGTSAKEEWALVSYLARANYAYKNRYLLSASVRSDKASRFGKGNRTGVFPSFSAGWRIIEESFLKNSTILSDLKIRGSWGKTGNFLIPNYASIGLLNPANYVFGNAIANGIAPSTPSNNALTWEKNTQTDLGLEIGFLKNRIFATADIYRKITSDLLLNVQVPAAVGFGTSSPLQNIGEVENKGIELSLSTRNLVGSFTWNTDLNFSANRNKVLKLGITGDPIFGASANDTRHVTRIGDAVGSYYGYVVDGIYQSQAEIDKAPLDKIAVKASPGDFRFKDVTGDNIVDARDRTVIGNYQPDFTYGVTNRFGYRGVELSFLIQGVEGSEILNLTRRHLANGEALTNSYAVETDRWISESQPGNGKIPRADKQGTVHNNNNRPSSFQIEDGSYLRLRNVTLAYTFPANALGKKFPGLRLYATGTNLFTSTNYIGYNPEVNNQSTSNNTPGEDYGAYPLTRNYTFGINVIFK